MKRKLTSIVVEKIAPPGVSEKTGKPTRLDVFDEYLPGFALRITTEGHRSYIARARIKGQAAPITVTIGSTKAFTLEEARQRASEVLRQMRAGADPRPQKIAPAALLTFDGLIEEWATLYLSRQHRPRYATETPRAIRRAFPGLLSRPAAEISRSEVVNALDKLAKDSPGAVRNAMAYGRACFAWAEQRGKLPSNPFSRLPVAKAGQRDRVLSDDEMAAIWAAVDQLGYPFGPYFKLLILTLQRREEVAGMRWSELDIDKAVWAIPAARMKMNIRHDVHLSEPARAVLAELPRLGDSDYVFTTGRRRTAGADPAPISGFSKSKHHCDKAIAAAGISLAHWTPHDFRRTGVSKLAELGFDSIVADKLLAHKPAKLQGAAAIYQRYDFARERAAALDAWAAHVTGAGTADNVLPLRRAAQ